MEKIHSDIKFLTGSLLCFFIDSTLFFMAEQPISYLLPSLFITAQINFFSFTTLFLITLIILQHYLLHESLILTLSMIAPLIYFLYISQSIFYRHLFGLLIAGIVILGVWITFDQFQITGQIGSLYLVSKIFGNIMLLILISRIKNSQGKTGNRSLAWF